VACGCSTNRSLQPSTHRLAAESWMRQEALAISKQDFPCEARTAHSMQCSRMRGPISVNCAELRLSSAVQVQLPTSKLHSSSSQHDRHNPRETR